MDTFDLKNYRNFELTNPYYDPDKTSNGGGYFQYYGEADLETPDGSIIPVSVEDTSCGEFGERVTVKIGDIKIDINTMDDWFAGFYTENGAACDALYRDLGILNPKEFIDWVVSDMDAKACDALL